MTIFDGVTLASEAEAALKAQVEEYLRQGGKPIKIAAVLYDEDTGSRLYSRLKQEAAERIGMEYQLHHLSLQDSIEGAVRLIKQLNADHSITGIIIQKPARSTWVEAKQIAGDAKATRQAFTEWWRYQTSQLERSKDVDGLHPELLEEIMSGESSKILPATAKAVLQILAVAYNHDSIESLLTDKELTQQATTILGRSDILGAPLFYTLKNAGWNVEMIGSAGLTQLIEQGVALKDRQVIISATGRKHLITGEMVGTDVVVIDVGEPQPDVDFVSVSQKARFITPVPGGVGPMTVVSLLENAFLIAQDRI